MYKQNAALETAPYADQLQARVDSLFGVADFYSRNLTELGHASWDLHINNEIMQRAWAREHGVFTNPTRTHSGARTLVEKIGRLRTNPVVRHLKPLLKPLIRKVNGQQDLLNIVAAQIRHYKPDVILNQAVEWVPDEFLHEIKDAARLIVGQIASPLSAGKRLDSYDLMISSLPNFVLKFRKQGMRSELVRLAFDASILNNLPERKASIGVSFVGTLSANHAERHQLLETIASGLELEVWGRIDAALPEGSPLQSCHRGPAWGKTMYAILQESRITLNYHIGLAGQYANNLRLFEATGVGTLLLTDHKDNLHEMFEPGKDVAVYRTPAECVEVARYYLDHERERQSVAKAGQQRTLRDHTYKLRMQELSLLLERYLGSKPTHTVRYLC